MVETPNPEGTFLFFFPDKTECIGKKSEFIFNATRGFGQGFAIKITYVLLQDACGYVI